MKPNYTSMKKPIKFVRAGQTPPKTKRKTTGLLHLSNQWKLLSDTDNSYSFPGHISLTNLRPDVVIFCNSLKRVILIELTCPCEENMDAWHNNKIAKYSSLCASIKKNRWTVDLFASAVGARGYCSRTRH